MATISDIQRKKIEDDARTLLKKFSSALRKVEVKQLSKSSLSEGQRVEGTGKVADSDFRSLMFANTPEKDDDLIIAEKKIW